MTDRKSLLMGAIPGIALAVLMVTAVPGSALVGSQATTDSVGPTGYVTVTVTRDGQEIYKHEDHNAIMNVGKEFIAEQIGSDSPGGNGANYIGLSSSALYANSAAVTTSGLNDTCLATTSGGDTPAEITANGLQRSQGTYTLTGLNTFTIVEEFTATGGSHPDVQRAGLFTAGVNGDPCADGNDGTMMAQNVFTPVSLSENDQLTITWTITLS